MPALENLHQRKYIQTGRNFRERGRGLAPKRKNVAGKKTCVDFKEIDLRLREQGAEDERPARIRGKEKKGGNRLGCVYLAD